MEQTVYLEEMPEGMIIVTEGMVLIGTGIRKGEEQQCEAI